LQEHKPPCDLVATRFVDLTNDAGVKDRDSKRFYQERPNVLSRNKRRKELQSFYGVESRAVTADEIQSRLKQVCGCVDTGTKVYPQKGQEDVIVRWCTWLIDALAVSIEALVRFWYDGDDKAYSSAFK
jgi:hypothetical protein